MCSHIGTNQQICLSAHVSSHNCCDSWRWGFHVLQARGLVDWKCPEVSTCFRLSRNVTRKRCKSPAGMKYIRMTSLHRRRSHPVAARKGIWFICATSARDARAFRSQNNSFATPYFGNTTPCLANRCRLNVLTCRLESWLRSGLWPFIVSLATLCHWARECGLQQALFITPKVIQSQGVWNTKTALAHSQSEGGEGCFPYTLVVNMRASLATILRGKNNVAMLCGDFAEWEFPAPAVWLQNSELESDHFAGQVCGHPVDYVQSHWHKSTNLSVCTRLQPQLLRQLEVRFTRAPGTRLRGLEMSRSLNLLLFESQRDR